MCRWVCGLPSQTLAAAVAAAAVVVVAPHLQPVECLGVAGAQGGGTAGPVGTVVVVGFGSLVVVESASAAVGPSA